MSAFQLVAILVALAAVSSYINFQFIHLGPITVVAADLIIGNQVRLAAGLLQVRPLAPIERLHEGPAAGNMRALISARGATGAAPLACRNV